MIHAKIVNYHFRKEGIKLLSEEVFSDEQRKNLLSVLSEEDVEGLALLFSTKEEEDEKCKK